jgi:peptidoglycan/LPS O-acetylase OafA/YrhL
VTLPWIARFAAGRELRVLIGLAVASMAAATAHRLVLTDANAWLFGTYPLAFYAFVPGMLLAVIQVKRPATFAMLRHPAVLVIGAGYIVAGALTTILPVALATGVGTALIMGFLLQHRLPFNRALGFGGGASYALYLWHKDAFIALGPVVGLAVAVVAAGLSWALVERPILRWIHALASVRRLARPTEPALEQAAASTP